MSKKPLFILMLILLAATAAQYTPRASAIFPTLTITLDPGKKSYNVGEYIQNFGALFYDWGEGSELTRIPVNDIVGLQVNYPSTYGNYLIRTLPTGSLAGKTWDVEILQLTPSDQNGNPQTVFQRGSLAYFAITWKNNLNETVYVRIIFTICYMNGLPIAVYSPTNGTLAPNETRPAILPFPINSDTATGSAVIYANAVSEWLDVEGYPYCPEKSANFTIVSSGGSYVSGTKPAQLAGVGTTFNFTFPTVTAGAYLGNYTTYATTRPLGTHVATNTTRFEVFLLGDVNGNLAVTVQDYQLVKLAIPSTPGSPKWNPKCDLNNDGVVDAKDYTIIKRNIGHFGHY